MKPAILASLGDVSEYSQQLRAEGRTLAFVPTMGALHDGHLSLVKTGKNVASDVLVSIFVNPTQFGQNEDFSKYPRTLEADVEKLAEAGTNAVFTPSTNDIYPDGYQTTVINRALSQDLCGRSRPGHFEGVLTVVLKLFNIVRPHYAIFGKKDYQQWRLIESMVRDFNLDSKIVGAVIVREVNGLAMSSRNQYFSPEERLKAGIIFKALNAAKECAKAGCRDVAVLLSAATKVLNECPELTREYLEIRSQKSLQPFEQGIISAPAVILIAARFANVRLIDNLELD